MGNTIVLSKEEFGCDLYNKMGELIDILTQAGYQVLVDAEIPGRIYSLQFEYSPNLEEDYGGNRFMSVSLDEYEYILDRRRA